MVRSGDANTSDEEIPTEHDFAVAMSSANGLIGTGFASRYRLQRRIVVFKGPVGRCKVTTPSF